MLSILYQKVEKEWMSGCISNWLILPTVLALRGLWKGGQEASAHYFGWMWASQLEPVQVQDPTPEFCFFTFASYLECSKNIVMACVLNWQIRIDLPIWVWDNVFPRHNSHLEDMKLLLTFYCGKNTPHEIFPCNKISSVQYITVDHPRKRTLLRCHALIDTIRLTTSGFPASVESITWMYRFSSDEDLQHLPWMIQFSP